MLSRKDVLAELPDGFACKFDKMRIVVYKLLKDGLLEFAEADKAVRKMRRKLKLTELGSGMDLMKGIRDWSFEIPGIRKEMAKDANAIKKLVRDFVKKYGDEGYDEEFDDWNVLEELEKMEIAQKLKRDAARKAKGKK